MKLGEICKTSYEDLKVCSERFADNRSLKRTNRLLTGVNILDDPLGGLMDTEFLIVAAATGMGKTTMGTMLATSSAAQGKKILYFALEAYHGEIEDRIKFSLLRKYVYDEKGYLLNFKKWYHGEYDMFSHIEKKIIDESSRSALDNILIMYREYKTPYTVETLSKQVETILVTKNVDIIIVDHLHYFDYDDYANENRAQKKIVTWLRDICIEHKIPIVLFAQLRKRDRKTSQIIPSIEDIMGSSDITKNVTAALTIGASKKDHVDAYNFPTYFHFGKNRFDGSLKRYVLESKFNTITNAYEDKYKLKYIDSDLTETNEVPLEHTPSWAINRTFS